MNKCIDCNKQTCRNKYKRCLRCSNAFRIGSKHPQYRHGLSHTRFNVIWKNIKGRCNNVQRPDHERYGGHGIKCLWKSFVEFRDDMYKSYLKHIEVFGEKDTQIDRRDFDGNYCKENCRWVDCKTQQRNKKSNHLITFNGMTFCGTEWGDIVGIPGKIILQRIKRNWSVEKALSTPTER